MISKFPVTIVSTISSLGVVSTYSIIINDLNGGVLAPNGDVHFINNGFAQGEKVSFTGIVSTYSVFNIGSYFGGVLSQNGDIHFIPLSANRGQKISTNVQQKVGYALSPFFNKF